MALTGSILMAPEESDSLKKPEAPVIVSLTLFSPALYCNLGKLLNWEEDSTHWEDCGSVARHSVSLPHTATSGTHHSVVFYHYFFAAYHVINKINIFFLLADVLTFFLFDLTWYYPGQMQRPIVCFCEWKKTFSKEMLGLRLENLGFSIQLLKICSNIWANSLFDFIIIYNYCAWFSYST